LAAQVKAAHEDQRAVTVPAGPRAAARPGPAALPQAGRPADAGPGPSGPGAEALEEDHHPRSDCRGEGGPDLAGLHARRVQGEHPLVRGHHHLYRDLRGLALPGHRHRHRLEARRRPRHGQSPAHRADRGRAVQRARRLGPGAGRDLPHRPRLPVHVCLLRPLSDQCEVTLSVGRTGQW
jgi:hypothetical protein